MIPFILTLTTALMFLAAGDTQPPPSKLTNKLIQLYELRIEAAKNDLAFDKVICQQRKDEYDTFNMLALTNAESKKNKRDAWMIYLKTKLNVEASEIALKEAVLMADLLKVGIDAGLIKDEDAKMQLLQMQERYRRGR